MKKYLILLVAFLLPVFAFAQTPEPPSDIAGIIEWVKIAFATWGGALGVVLLATEKVKRILNLKGTGAVILSWLIAFPLTALAWWLQLGILSGVAWYIAAIYAASFSLSANLVYLTPLIKELVRVVIDYIDSKKLAKANKPKE